MGCCFAICAPRGQEDMASWQSRNNTMPFTNQLDYWTGLCANVSFSGLHMSNKPLEIVSSSGHVELILYNSFLLAFYFVPSWLICATHRTQEYWSIPVGLIFNKMRMMNKGSINTRAPNYIDGIRMTTQAIEEKIYFIVFQNLLHENE